MILSRGAWRRGRGGALGGEVAAPAGPPPDLDGGLCPESYDGALVGGDGVEQVGEQLSFRAVLFSHVGGDELAAALVDEGADEEVGPDVSAYSVSFVGEEDLSFLEVAEGAHEARAVGGLGDS